MDLWNRQEAVNVDLTKRSEDWRHEAVNQQECRIRGGPQGTIVLPEAFNLKGKGSGEARLVVVVAAPAANLGPIARAGKG